MSINPNCAIYPSDGKPRAFCVANCGNAAKYLYKGVLAYCRIHAHGVADAVSAYLRCIKCDTRATLGKHYCKEHSGPKILCPCGAIAVYPTAESNMRPAICYACAEK